MNIKLSLLSVKIGYPSKWRDYSQLEVSADDLVGDVVHASAFEWNRRLHHLGHRPRQVAECGEDAEDAVAADHRDLHMLAPSQIDD